MKLQKKTLLRLTGAAAVASAAAVSYSVTSAMVDLALDRNEPKAAVRAGNALSGVHINETFLHDVQLCSQQLLQRPSKTVNILSRDGIVLTGHWVPQPNAKRILVAMHGWRSSWYRDFGMIAPFWEASGCSVLYADQRGQNESGGQCMGLGVMERYDCLDWVNWVNSHGGDKLPIYLAGVSMGATTVLMAGGLELPANVHGICGDCGFTSPAAISKHVANKNLHMVFGPRLRLAAALWKKKLPVGFGDCSTTKALRHCDIPVFLAHGTDDHFVPVEMSYENYLACRGPKELFVVPGADHGMSYYCNREGYEDAARRFWAKYD